MLLYRDMRQKLKKCYVLKLKDKTNQAHMIHLCMFLLLLLMSCKGNKDTVTSYKLQRAEKNMITYHIQEKAYTTVLQRIEKFLTDHLQSAIVFFFFLFFSFFTQEARMWQLLMQFQRQET